MLVLSQASGGALSARRCSLRSSPAPTSPNSPLFSNRKSRFVSTINPKKPFPLTLAKAEQGVDSSSATTKPSFPTSSSDSPAFENDQMILVGQESVPLEGVIQFEKPDSSSRFKKWGRVALFSGGDVLALLVFAAIGRFSHGFSVFDTETLRTADPFIAGWFLSAYFLGGYGEDGRGMNGVSKGVTAAAKSWALGIPLGMVIRAVTTAHFPSYQFILVTMGSTAVLLIGWRALVYRLLPSDKSKKGDVYRHGSPFELFELLTSLVRRW
ncbi:Transmembrane protein [Trema orientale]|uniref:Transmembrane protein n=1 Tax=Trema orientale TaxID=63057 RepID=A0A2P5G126_TREOI|nr:Transmembrane protein [Trema orientale]